MSEHTTMGTSPQDDDLAAIAMSAEEYSSHRDQLKGALPTQERTVGIQRDLSVAFARVIVLKEVPFISFCDLNAEELAQAFFNYPSIVKPVLSCVNVAGRAIKRDLGVSIDTYGEKLTVQQASLLAGFIRPILPDQIAIPALMELDRYFWTDKQMRATKGSWETTVRDQLNVATGVEFKKRKFVFGSEKYELDAAYPIAGEPILVGIDVKRIEAQQDIHKRSDEIIHKAIKFKGAYPEGLFVVVVYFPFPSQHSNLQNRLKNAAIDHIFFAGESSSSICNCVEMLAGVLSPIVIQNK